MTVSTRSGGDALKQRDCRFPLRQAIDERSSKVEDYWNAKNDAAKIKIDRHGAGGTDWIESVAPCPVYYPSKEEFAQDPLCYIQKIAPEASKYGMCKIVSPVVASVPAGVVLSREQSGFRFTTRVQPMRLSNWDKDDKITFPMSGRHYTLTEYEKVANKVFARKFSTSASLPSRFIETEFWKELVSGKTRTVEYATDVEGSAFSKSSMDPLGQSKWNLKGISQLPSSTLRLLETAIPGVTEPMLYIGMLFSMFAWHIEDHYLYSINYHHCGASKTWYGVPGSTAPNFEQVVQHHVYNTEMLKDTGKGAELDLLLGKTTMFAPKLLAEHGVPVFKTLQNPGEFIVTFPRAYHSGFSHGFNCGEAVNFAMADWFSLGAAACTRYEFLSRVSLLPHEELLCKEAMIIYQADQNCTEDLDDRKKTCVKAEFVAFMRSHLQVHSLFKEQGARITTSNFTNVLCDICKHICYVAYTTCKCFPEPTCFNHGNFLGNCTCGGDRVIFTREDFAELEAAAQKYECDEHEVQKIFSAHDSLVRNQDNLVFKVGDEEIQFENISSAQAKDCSVLGEMSPLEGIRQRVCVTSSICKSESCGRVAPLDCKQGEEEDDSDTEAFRVKRRRVLPPHSKRFQVDEQGISPKEPSVKDSRPVFDKESADFRGQERTSVSMLKGSEVLAHDVIKALDIKGSTTEVIGQWQCDARSRGMILETKNIILGGENVVVLSFKSLACLKQLVSKQGVGKLERLMQQHFGCAKVDLSSTTHPNLNFEPACTNKQAVGEIAETSKPCLASAQDKSESNGRSMEEEILTKRQQVSGAISEADRSTSDHGRTTVEECFLLSELDECSEIVKSNVEGPPVPLQKDDIIAMVTEVPKQPLSPVDFVASSETGTTKPTGLSVRGDIIAVMMEPKQSLDPVDCLASCETGATKLLEEHGQSQTNSTSTSEPKKKGLVIHLNRKVEPSSNRKAASNADFFRDDESNISELLQQTDMFETKPESSCCMTVRSYAGESMDDGQFSPVEHLALSSNKYAGGQNHGLKADSLLEEGELRVERQKTSIGSQNFEVECLLGARAQWRPRTNSCSTISTEGENEVDTFENSNALSRKFAGSEMISSNPRRETENAGCCLRQKDYRFCSVSHKAYDVACSSRQNSELSCPLRDEVSRGLSLPVMHTLRDKHHLEFGDSDATHSSGFSTRLYQSESLASKIVDQPAKAHYYQRGSHGGQKMKWSRPCQGDFDFCLPHYGNKNTHPTGMSSSHRHGLISRSRPSFKPRSSHRYHHNPRVDSSRKHSHVSQAKERMPFGYRGRPPPNAYSSSGWRTENFEMNRNSSAPDNLRVSNAFDRQVGNSAAVSVYDEGYDPSKWEIFPVEGKSWQYSASQKYLPTGGRRL